MKDDLNEDLFAGWEKTKVEKACEQLVSDFGLICWTHLYKPVHRPLNRDQTEKHVTEFSGMTLEEAKNRLAAKERTVGDGTVEAFVDSAKAIVLAREFVSKGELVHALLHIAEANFLVGWMIPPSESNYITIRAREQGRIGSEKKTANAQQKRERRVAFAVEYLQENPGARNKEVAEQIAAKFGGTYRTRETDVTAARKELRKNNRV